MQTSQVYSKQSNEFYPSVSIIADSLNSITGDRLTTMVLKYHRFIHSEMMTHRVFSRNASSSRAIPVEKMIDKVLTDNVYPLHFGKNKKGMQATEEIAEIETAKKYWDWAREDAIHRARLFIELGVHKQVINRLLEPFSTITVIVTSSEWQNFFSQRCCTKDNLSDIKSFEHTQNLLSNFYSLGLKSDAQPEILALAMEMRTAYNESKPQLLNPGVWHLPFIQNNDLEAVTDRREGLGITQDLLKISVGRCARVSYLNHDGIRNIEADIQLHNRLLASNPHHLSPFEHQAVASDYPSNFANFTGFQSYRNILEKSQKLS